MPSAIFANAMMETAARRYYDDADADALALCRQIGISVHAAADAVEVIALSLKSAYHRGAIDAIDTAKAVLADTTKG